MQWNLNIQRQLTNDLTADLGYVGSHGVHQPMRIDDSNIVQPTLTSAGYVWPSPVGSGTLVNPNFGEIRSMQWNRHLRLPCPATEPNTENGPRLPASRFLYVG
jgi:hypothetical protein